VAELSAWVRDEPAVLDGQPVELPDELLGLGAAWAGTQDEPLARDAERAGLLDEPLALDAERVGLPAELLVLDAEQAGRLLQLGPGPV
jgi:hypothetical protein